ncbi:MULTISPECIES: MFS transporter [Ensifer]|jgi:MFS family permease|uniref:MFS transporter n=1 Tax=Ensifer canadensis TaxID=555315 RepID=A0AAW4FF25_9HYPH|nr:MULTISPECIES: MFS transporter [Ensifer]MDP9628052.1 MFS family permease [Ensifer adhaerens]KQU72210.1 MFS transporter [Ensifer sp. Root31]KQW84564.1 MFS transporter [Ensifer sp. Root127]KQY71716.1 MFS transporter [Ensifer sp. Root142]MBD9486857.1 MFS transporter [Ensifer sp. ENS11]
MTSKTVEVGDIAPDWPAIIAVVLGVTAFSVAQGLTYPLISLSLEGRGVSAATIGLNAMGFAAGLAAATLLLGHLTRLASADKLIIASLCGCSLCLATLASTSSLPVWFIARFALGFFVSMVFMLGEAWLNTACPDRLRGRVSGLYGAGMCGGFAAGPLAIPLLGTSGGLGFALLAIYIALVAFLTGLLTMGARTRPEPSSTRDLFAFFRHAPTLILMVLMFGFADIAAISAMPVYFVKSGHSQAFAALSVTVLAVPTALAQPFIGVLLDKLPRRRVAITAAAVAATGYLAIPLVTSAPLLLALFALIGAASFALYTAALTMLGEQYRGSMLVAGSAAFSLAYAAGSAAGSGATGFLMALINPTAGPLGVGMVLVMFTLIFAVAGRR